MQFNYLKSIIPREYKALTFPTHQSMSIPKKEKLQIR